MGRGDSTNLAVATHPSRVLSHYFKWVYTISSLSLSPYTTYWRRWIILTSLFPSILSIFCVFTPLQLHFEPIFDLSNVLQLTHYLGRAYTLSFLSPTNLYYILLKLKHSNFIIFFNIVGFVFLTPL